MVALNSYTPPPPTANFCSYEWQVSTFESLLNRNPLLQVSENDIFVYESVGENDLFLYLLTPQPSLDVFSQQVAQSCVANLNTLYQRGMRRLFLTTFDFTGVNPDLPDLSIIPGFVQLSGANAPNPGIDFFNMVINYILNDPTNGVLPAIQAQVDANNWPGLELNILSMAAYYGNMRDNQPLNGIAYPVVGTYTPYDFNTAVGQGAWPVTESAPIKPAFQYMFADSLHFTEHSQKLASQYLKSWIAPLPTVEKKCCKHHCKKCVDVLKKPTDPVPEPAAISPSLRVDFHVKTSL